MPERFSDNPFCINEHTKLLFMGWGALRAGRSASPDKARSKEI